MENIFIKIKNIFNIKKVGFFPGKFNPPHMGHFLTIMKLAKEYKLIVGLTEDIPENPFPRQLILKYLKQLEDYGIKIVEIKGRLIDKDDLSDLPAFDILLSGNPIVLKWAKKMNIAYKLVKRSGELSGKQIRHAS